MGDRPTRCRVVSNIVEPCWALADALEEENSLKKGLSELVIRHRDTLEVVRTGVVLRSGSFGRRGILINYCPFCGENIARAFEQEEEKTA